MSATPLTLKNPRGWFAAGAEVQRALGILTDGAFKLFVHICLNARRDTGVLQMSQTELARHLDKSIGSVRRYLREMEAAGICQCHFDRSPFGRGRVKIDSAYWPYQTTPDGVPDDGAQMFISEIRKILQARACVRPSFSIADEILAREWFERGVVLERVERAILTGCARKYVSWRNNQSFGPITSLRYFEPILEEMADLPKVNPDYWDYLRSRIERMEKLWIESHLRGAEPGEAIGRDGDPAVTTSHPTG